MRVTTIFGATVLLGAGPAYAQVVGGADYPAYEPSPSVKRGYTAEGILDSEVRGKDGKTIGEVEDVIIGPDGKIRRLIVGVNEGIFDIGGRRLAVNWGDAKVGAVSEGEVDHFFVPVTKNNVEEYGIFKDKPKTVKGGKREWRASELIGDYISLKDISNYGSVTDLMFDRQGQLQAIAASPDMTGSVLEFYAPYSGDDAGWDPGDEYYVVPYTSSELKELLPKDATRTRRASSRD